MQTRLHVCVLRYKPHIFKFEGFVAHATHLNCFILKNKAAEVLPVSVITAINGSY